MKVVFFKGLCHESKMIFIAKLDYYKKEICCLQWKCSKNQFLKYLKDYIKAHPNLIKYLLQKQLFKVKPITGARLGCEHFEGNGFFLGWAHLLGEHGVAHIYDGHVYMAMTWCLCVAYMAPTQHP